MTLFFIIPPSVYCVLIQAHVFCQLLLQGAVFVITIV